MAKEIGFTWERPTWLLLHPNSSQHIIIFPSQAFRLNSGFNCTDKCHLCDGCEWHKFGADAPWKRMIGNNRYKSPFKPREIPLLSIPGMCSTAILPDSCHCFHLGWGVDLAASGLVLLAKNGEFPGRTLVPQLREAYSRFMTWCKDNKKTSSILWWSYQKLDMKSNLDLDLLCRNMLVPLVWFLSQSINTLIFVAPSNQT